jgi:sugar phosphate permease
VQQRRALVLVFFPFVSGYYLSYIYRTINALISADLTAELRFNAADLGLLTSTYFLTFAIAQLPLGILLDRYGPRRVKSALDIAAGAEAATSAGQHDRSDRSVFREIRLSCRATR